MKHGLLLESHNTIQENLFRSFSERNIKFSKDYLCMQCLGILIDPMQCKSCHSTSCRNCIEQISPSELFCECSEGEIKEFEPCIISNLDKTEYLIQDNQDKGKYSLYLYSEAIKRFENNFVLQPNYPEEKHNETKICSYDIIRVNDNRNNYCDHEDSGDKFYNRDDEYERVNYYRNNYCYYEDPDDEFYYGDDDYDYEEMLEAENSYIDKKNAIKKIIQKYMNCLNFKKILIKLILKMIKFNCSKGYNLNLREFFNSRKITSKDLDIFQFIHLKSLKLHYIDCDLNCAISLAKLIRNNRKYLNYFNLGEISINRKTEMKVYHLFYKVLPNCRLLKRIHLQMHFDQFHSNLDHSLKLEYNYFKFFTLFKNLNELSLNQLYLSDLELNIFPCFFLHILKIKSCHFEEKIFLSFMESILKNKSLRYISFFFVFLHNDYISDLLSQENFQKLFLEQSKMEKFRLKGCNTSEGISKFWDLSNLSVSLPRFSLNLFELDIELDYRQLKLKIIEEFCSYLESTNTLKKFTLCLLDCLVGYLRAILTAISINNSIKISN